MNPQWSIREWWPNDWNNIGPYPDRDTAAADAARRFKGYTYGGAPLYLEILCNGAVVEKWTRETYEDAR